MYYVNTKETFNYILSPKGFLDLNKPYFSMFTKEKQRITLNILNRCFKYTKRITNVVQYRHHKNLNHFKLKRGSISNLEIFRIRC